MINIKYEGTNQAWYEMAYTGKQSVWKPGQMEDRPESEAASLMATGLFSTLPVPVFAQNNPLTGGVKDLGNPGLVPVVSQRVFLPCVGVGGSEWYSNGARWKPVSGNVILGDLQTVFSGAPQTAAQVLAEVRIKAGTIQDGDIIRVTSAIHKSGTSDTVTRAHRIGSVQGAINGAVLLGGNSAPGTTNRSFGEVVYFRRVSATQLRPLGNGSSVSPFNGSSTAGALATATVSNMDDADLYLASVITMTSGTETPSQDTYLIELIACGA